MNVTKDYYGILGILPSAEFAVIKAAYKAMMTIYHPDKCQCSKEDAHKRCVEINEAHNVLSDKSKRAHYDKEREKLNTKFSFREEEQTHSASNTLTKDWSTVTKYHPNLDSIEKDLDKLSPKLAFSFKLKMLEEKRFNQALGIARNMEFDFLENYFGENSVIKDFAKQLLMSERRDAAKQLNKVITLLGNDINPYYIIDTIENEFNLKQEIKKNKIKDDLFILYISNSVIFILLFIFISISIGFLIN